MTVSRRALLAGPTLLAAGVTVGHTTFPLIGTAAAATVPVTFDAFSLEIKGRRVYHWCAEFHYWRLPSPDLWRDVLQKYRAAGFTAASVYFHWGYHSPAPGVYDFSGIRDIEKLLRIASEVGIYIVARPGPYINAETDAGGFPGWVLTQAGVARSSAPDYLAASLEWFANVNAILSRYQIGTGGPIILYQIENEYSLIPIANPPLGLHDVAYMQALEAAARTAGITVPLFHNDAFPEGSWAPGTPGGVDIYGFDSYPQNFDASNPTVWNQVPDFVSVRAIGSALTPLDLTEGQGGSFDPWGGPGYAACRKLTNANFTRIFVKNNIAAGVTMQNLYMVFGGTSWGWLPEPTVYTSYDYGAPITEGRQLTGKYSEIKKLGYFLASVEDIRRTSQLPDAVSTNAKIRVRHMANPSTLTQFFTILHADSTSTTVDTLNFQLSLADAAYQSVPQQGSLVINGRDAKLLVAGYAMNHQSLMYSTSEIMTHFHVGVQDAAVFYGRNGEPGETVLRFAARPTISDLLGTVSSTYDPSSGDLRLNYIHQGLILVMLESATMPLLLAICDDATAATFWRVDAGDTPVLIQGPALVRTTVIVGDTIEITGDSAGFGVISVFTAPSVRHIRWNGAPTLSVPLPHGGLSGLILGPLPVRLPALTHWVAQHETLEAQPGFDDSTWLPAVNTGTNNPTKPPAGEVVLYADDYGFHHGDIWYRARFTAAGTETGITLNAASVFPGRIAAWINGVYAGDIAETGAAQTLAFPAGALKAGQTNVVSILVENVGHNEDTFSEETQKEPRGLTSGELAGSDAALAWKIQGNQGGQTLVDPTRGPYNNGGLYGERNGWHLPGFPTDTWSPIALPATNFAPGITWYSTNVALDLPPGQDVSIGLQITDDKTRDYHLRIFVNGWHMGLYVANVGPQSNYVIPNGILNTGGSNRITIASWSFGDGTGGLGALSLTILGNVAGGIPVSPVTSPGYPAIFG